MLVSVSAFVDTAETNLVTDIRRGWNGIEACSWMKKIEQKVA